MALPIRIEPGSSARVFGRARPRLGGFTLLELSVVLAVIGIGALITRASIPAHERGAELAAFEIAAALRFAERESAAGQVRHGVEIDVTNARLRVFRHDQGDPPARVFDIYHPVSKQPWDVSLRTLPGAGGLSLGALVATYEGSCTVDDAVVFDAWGMPRCDAVPAVPLRAGVWQVVGGPRVSLEGFSGRVTVQ